MGPLTGVCAILVFAGNVAMFVTPSIREALSPAQTLVAIITCAIVCVIGFVPPRSVVIRCLTVVGIAIAYGMNIVAYAAFELPGVYVGLVVLVVMVTLIAGARAAWLTLAAMFVSFFIVAALHVTEYLPTQKGLLDSRLAMNWLTVVNVFMLASAGVIIAVSFLLEKLENEVRGSRERSRATITALTKQHAFERSIVESQKTEALGKLAGGMAHDFNNLLTVIVTSVQLAEELVQDASARELLQEARDASARAAELTRDLLAFSSQRVVENQTSNLAHVVTHLLRLVRRLLPKNVNVEVTEIDPSIWVDLSQIELDQILLNLCINARDAMPSGGKIVLGVTRCGDERVCLSVKDTGAGMDPETAAHIFEPFFSTKAAGQGTGLGLAVVRAIVDKRGGKIEVESSLGEGSDFRITLLVADAPSVLPVEKLTPRPSTTQQTVLVAEDDPAIRRLLTRVLEGAGYRTIVCENGEQALASVTDEVCLIVTDVIMPGMDGRTLHDRVMLARPKMRFLFCSGYTSTLLTDEVLKLEGRDFLAKPFLPDALLGKVRALLSRG